MASRVRWFGNAAHFICGQWCRFHMATQVGKYLVSTVGEYWPERSSREIHARIHDPAWHAENNHRKGDDYDFHYMKRFGYHTLGAGDGTYETMVFKAGKPCTAKGCGCGIPSIDGSELDGTRYTTAGDATAGHMKFVAKWSRPPKPRRARTLRRFAKGDSR